MKPGEIKVINGKIYGMCSQCESIVRIDKPLIGSLHLCSNTPPEQTALQIQGQREHPHEYGMLGRI